MINAQSTDLTKTSIVNENKDIVFGSYDTTGQVLETQSVGYSSDFTLLYIPDMGLQNSIVDCDVWLEEITDVGGGVSQYNYYKLPFTHYLGNGTVRQSASSNVFYQANTPKGPDTAWTGLATLEVTYRNNVTATQYPVFYYRVSNRGILR